MKQEPCFKYLAAALIAGVILAVFDPTPVLDQSVPADPVTAATSASVLVKR